MTVKIASDMTVKDINMKFPACKEVFKKYGIGGCGGEYGPPEPLDFFAKAHNVNLDQLIRDLEDAAQSVPGEPTKPTSPTQDEVDEARLNKLYKLFIKAAFLITLLGGTPLGLMALYYQETDYSLIQAHGHLQMFGFIGLFIMGVSYYVLPKFKMSKLKDTALSYLSFILMTAGVIIRGISQPAAHIKPFGYLNVLSGALELVAIGIYGFLLLRVVIKSTQGREFFEKYIYAGIGYLFICAVWNFFLLLDMSQAGINIIQQPYNSAFLHIALIGFIGMLVLGVSMRVLPHFMGLKEPNARLSDMSFYLINAGLVLNIFGSFVGDFILSSRLLFISYLLEFHGALLFLAALKLFAKSRVKLNIEGVDNAYIWFIKLAYFWFIISFLMIFLGSYYQLKSGSELEHFYIVAYRHIFTVGFVVTIIMGVAYRVLPVFNGTNLYSNKLMRASFFFLFFGNISRILYQLGMSFFESPPSYLVGSAGYFEWTALILFSYNIWRTLNWREPPAKQATADSTCATEDESAAITNSSKVYEVLTKYPEIRGVFVELGFTKLRDPDFVKLIPKFVTLSQACKVEGVDLDKAIKTLNDKLDGRQ